MILLFTSHEPQFFGGQGTCAEVSSAISDSNLTLDSNQNKKVVLELEYLVASQVKPRSTRTNRRT